MTTEGFVVRRHYLGVILWWLGPGDLWTVDERRAHVWPTAEAAKAACKGKELAYVRPDELKVVKL